MNRILRDVYNSDDHGKKLIFALQTKSKQLKLLIDPIRYHTLNINADLTKDRSEQNLEVAVLDLFQNPYLRALPNKVSSDLKLPNQDGQPKGNSSKRYAEPLNSWKWNGFCIMKEFICEVCAFPVWANIQWASGLLGPTGAPSRRRRT